MKGNHSYKNEMISIAIFTKRYTSVKWIFVVVFIAINASNAPTWLDCHFFVVNFRNGSQNNPIVQSSNRKKCWTNWLEFKLIKELV